MYEVGICSQKYNNSRCQKPIDIPGEQAYIVVTTVSTLIARVLKSKRNGGTWKEVEAAEDGSRRKGR